MADYMVKEWPSVYKGALKTTKNSVEADDLMQKLYLYYKAKGTTIDLNKGRPWAYVFASMHKTYHTERARNRELLTDSGTVRAEGHISPVDQDWKLSLRKYLELRPGAQKDLVKNKILELLLKDYNVGEIAKELKLDVRNVQSQRRHLILELRKIAKQQAFLKGV